MYFPYPTLNCRLCQAVVGTHLQEYDQGSSPLKDEIFNHDAKSISLGVEQRGIITWSNDLPICRIHTKGKTL